MRTNVIGVRRAETRDAEAITAVHDTAWRYAYDGMIPAKELARIIARRGARWWDRAIRRGTAILVLEVGGTICGYATVGPNRARNLPQKGEVYEIYMKPEYQGVGLGTRLFLTARRELARFGFDTIVVWALADNENACRFYKNAGGRKVARASERFGDVALTKIAYAWGRGA
ncbi:MAG: GNAT family N-acetyltransferase [Bauldia sp.]|nr:GNAT family N-acetyltransferase [Bauldia sp.]